MTEPIRVTPKEAHQKLKSGTTLLICAYDDVATFKQMQLEGAISLKEFQSRLPSLTKDQEIVFYCGWPREASAAGRAADYLKKGYKNANVLGGGVNAWEKEGYPIKTK